MMVIGLGLLSNFDQVFANSEAEKTEAEVQSPTIIFNPTRDPDRVELRQNRIETRVTQSQIRIEERETSREERRADFAEQHADRIERRFSLYAQHLFNIASRIEVRAQMMSKNGKNVSEALTKVTEAKNYINEAQVKTEEAVTKFRSIDPAEYDTQREIALAARDLAEEGRNDFKTARDLLHEAVKILVANQIQN